MEKSKIIKKSLLNGLGVLAYVAIIALIFRYANQIFGQVNNFWGPFAFLLLFVISAAIVGWLVLGKPVFLYLDNQKKEAISMLYYTIGWLIIVAIIIFVVLAIVK